MLKLKGNILLLEENNMDLNQTKLIPVNVNVNSCILNDEPTLRVVKAQKLYQFDENTYAKLSKIDFHNGTINVQVLSSLLPDAPDFARGFIGIAFRINNDDSAFESFYIRPTNGQTTDSSRKQHAVQYFSYPKYNFNYFRKHNITAYENSADIELNQWISLKAIIKDGTGLFYINSNPVPVLTISHLMLGSSAHGSIGFFVDIGTEGFFKNLQIRPND